MVSQGATWADSTWRAGETPLLISAGTWRSLRLTIGQTPRLVVLGLGIGVAAAFVAMRALAGVLYGITPTDPAAFITVTVLLGVAGLGASWLPARRAARLDPAKTLRSE